MRKLKANEIEEKWKDVPNYEGLYKISSSGIVKSYCGNWGEHIINGYVSEKGYAYVSLYKNNIKKTFFLHRLVASVFIENPNNKPQINHKDGNKLNNKVNNLEWCSQSENQIHAFKTGLNFGRKGVLNGHHRHVIQYDKNMVKIKTWETITEAKNKLGIDASNICNCCKGKLKSIGGFIFRYEEAL